MDGNKELVLFIARESGSPSLARELPFGHHSFALGMCTHLALVAIAWALPVCVGILNPFVHMT